MSDTYALAIKEDWRCGFNTACTIYGITDERPEFYRWLPLDVVGNTPRVSVWGQWVGRFEARLQPTSMYWDSADASGTFSY